MLAQFGFWNKGFIDQCFFFPLRLFTLWNLKSIGRFIRLKLTISQASLTINCLNSILPRHPLARSNSMPDPYSMQMGGPRPQIDPSMGRAMSDVNPEMYRGGRMPLQHPEVQNLLKTLLCLSLSYHTLFTSIYGLYSLSPSFFILKE